MADVVPMSELALMNQLTDISCSYCGKNISKYPTSLKKAVLKSECGCYYHLECFVKLCNEADDPNSLQCMKCHTMLDPDDCKYADDLLNGETELVQPELFYAHPEPEGGGKKRRKKSRKTKKNAEEKQKKEEREEKEKQEEKDKYFLNNYS